VSRGSTAASCGPWTTRREPIVTVDVDSVDDMVKKVEAAGGTIVLSKQTIPGVGYQAYATDPDGTIFGIHQRDESAAEQPA
jgi:uncharacterized protein